MLRIPPLHMILPAAPWYWGLLVFVLFLVTSTACGEPQPTPTATSTPLPTATPSSLVAPLAKYLTDHGAAMYGAYWCSHCADQKAMFGDALRYVHYVECDPAGKDANPVLCTQKGINAYPTWEIGGQFYQGTLSLEQLASLSGFTPPQP